MSDFEERVRILAKEFSHANAAAIAMAGETAEAKTYRDLHSSAAMTWIVSRQKSKDALANRAVIAKRGESIDDAIKRVKDYHQEWEKTRNSMAKLWDRAGGAFVRLTYKTAVAAHGGTSDYLKLVGDIDSDLPAVADPVVEILRQRDSDKTKIAFFERAAVAFMEIRDKVGEELIEAFVAEIAPLLEAAIEQNRDSRAKLIDLLTIPSSRVGKTEIELAAQEEFLNSSQLAARSMVTQLEIALAEISPSLPKILPYALPRRLDDNACFGMPKLVHDHVRSGDHHPRHVPADLKRAIVFELARHEGRAETMIARARKAVDIARLHLSTEDRCSKLKLRRVNGIDGAFEGGYKWTLTPYSDPKGFVQGLCAGREFDLFEDIMRSDRSARIVHVLQDLSLAIDLTELVALRDYSKLPRANEVRKEFERAYDVLKEKSVDFDRVDLALATIPSLSQITRVADQPNVSGGRMAKVAKLG